MIDSTNNYSIINIFYICYLLFIGIYYNYTRKSIKKIIKHYLYFIILHILYNFYIYIFIVIKYIFYQTSIACIIILTSYIFIKLTIVYNG